MTIDDIRAYLEKSPRLLAEIKKVMDYRNLRTEQAYYSKLLNEYRMMDYSWDIKISKTVRNAGELEASWWKEKTIELDKARRGKHNGALMAFADIVNTGKENGLPEIYNGRLLSLSEICKHDDPVTREEMTDGMFDILRTIENAVIQKEPEQNESIKEVQKEMVQFNRAYHVKQSMIKDEDRRIYGGVEFDRDLATIFDSFFE